MSSLADQASSVAAPHSQIAKTVRKVEKALGKAEACHQCRKRKIKCNAERPCSNCRRTHNKIVRVNPHLSNAEPNCTYDDENRPWDIEVDLSPESLRKLEARVEELEGMLRSGGNRNTQPSSSFGSPSSSYPKYSPESLFDEETQEDFISSIRFDLPLVVDEWPTTLPPKQLVLHLVDLFFNCCSNSRRVLHRPTFLMSLFEPPSSPRFPYVGLIHSICACAALHSPYVTVAPLPTLLKRPTEDIFEIKTHKLGNRELGFDEENYLLSKYQCWDTASRGERPLEVVQAFLINSWWAFSCGRWFDVWGMSTQAMRLCVALGLNFNDNLHRPVPYHIRDTFLIPPPQSHVEVELRRNIFWLVYAVHRFHLVVTPFPLDLNDEDISQTLPGTLEAFEAGIDDGQERQTALSADLFTTHRDNLDDFGLYIKGAIMLSRVHVVQFRYLQDYETEQEIRDSEEMGVMETIISSMKSSTLKGRFGLKEQPSPDAISNLYMAHTGPQLATLVCHMPIANWSDPSCESANKALGAARAILRYATSLVSTSWDFRRLDKAATMGWYMSGKTLSLALRHCPESLAPVLRAEIGLIRKTFLTGANRVMLFVRQLHNFDRELVEILGEKEASILFISNGF